MKNPNRRPTLVVKIYEIKVNDDGEVKVRRVPEDTHCMGMTFYDEDKLAEEVLSYGVKEAQDLEDMWTVLATTKDYEWVTV